VGKGGFLLVPTRFLAPMVASKIRPLHQLRVCKIFLRFTKNMKSPTHAHTVQCTYFIYGPAGVHNLVGSALRLAVDLGGEQSI
jgi:hypothetical protein